MHLVQHLAAETPDEKQAKKSQKGMLQVLHILNIYIYDYMHVYIL